MKAKIHKDAIQVFQAAIHIGTATKRFTPEEYAKTCEMSPASLRRYTDPEARESSRRAARAQTKRKAQQFTSSRGKCHTCKEALVGHKRCRACSILIHHEVKQPRDKRRHNPTLAHGDSHFCVSCYTRRI